MTNSLSQKIHGILLPATTPFTGTGKIDFNGLRLNLSRWCTTGITGIVFLGSTGERVHLNEREYRQVIEAGRAEISSEFACIVGAGQQSTVGTIDEVSTAVQSGADAVLVITPHFYRSAITQQTLLNYYTAVADAAKVPVLLYSMSEFSLTSIEHWKRSVGLIHSSYLFRKLLI